LGEGAVILKIDGSWKHKNFKTLPLF